MGRSKKGKSERPKSAKGNAGGAGKRKSGGQSQPRKRAQSRPAVEEDIPQSVEADPKGLKEVTDRIEGLRSAIREEVIAMLSESSPRLLKSNELSKGLGIAAESPEYEIVREVIDELTEANVIFRGPRRRYGRVIPDSAIEGRLKMIDSGRWELIPEGGSRPVMRFDREEISTAFDGDIVRARAVSATHPGDIPWGEVTRVIERKNEEVVGTLQRGRGIYLRPDTKKVHRTISIERSDLNKGKVGDKVVVELLEWDDPEEDPTGRVIRTIGRAGDMSSEIASIVEQFDVPTEFPEDVLAEAEAFPDKLTDADMKGRRDLRDDPVFTIDPHDARDFDDAISLRRHDDGDMTLGVHIADVSHYVQEGSALDREAFQRGTSIYLVTGVIPMLPERLSNNLCSLVPHEDRPAYTVEVRLSPNGAIREYEIFKSVINSKHRFTYEEALEVLESGKGPFNNDLTAIHALVKALRRNRRRKGSIDFSTTELKFRLDDDGQPVEVIPKTANEATKLIEDCMLLANRVVAEHIGTFKYLDRRKRGSDRNPFIYRVHDVPPKDKLLDLVSFVKGFGYKLPVDNIQPKDLQRLVDESKEKDQQELITNVTLRAMAKAVYSEHSIGHFGLAFDWYTHFTSPIRRYPDLIVHRLLTEYAEGMSGKKIDHYAALVGHIADVASRRERVAVEAERKSIKIAEVAYLSKHVGDIFEATVISVLPFGMFTELESLGIQGLIPTRTLDGYYRYDEQKRELVDGRGKKTFRIGDKLRVQVVKVDEINQQIDLGLVDDLPAKKSKPQRKRSRRK